MRARTHTQFGRDVVKPFLAKGEPLYKVRKPQN